MNKFFKQYPKRIRTLYWFSVVIVMVFIICPMFFFFYLFNQSEVRQLLHHQFDNNQYHIEIQGQISPQFWHGLSIEVTNLQFVANNNLNLLHVQNLNCQLSWLDLIIGRYRINRLELDNVTVYDDNILRLNWNKVAGNPTQIMSAFQSLQVVKVTHINSIFESSPYAMHNGSIAIRRIPFSHNISVQFRLRDNITVNIISNIDVTNPHTIACNNVIIDIKTLMGHMHIMTKTIYHIGDNNLWLHDLQGKINTSHYTGNITIESTQITYNKLSLFHVLMQVDSPARYTSNIKIAQVNYTLNSAWNIHNLEASSKFEYQSNIVHLKSQLSLITANSMGISSHMCKNQLQYNDNKFGNIPFNLITVGDCDYNFEKQQFKTMVTGLLNQTPIQLKLNMVYGTNNKPQILMSGMIESLNLTPIKPIYDHVTPTYFTNTPVPFNWLSVFDLQGNLILHHLIVNQLKLDNVKTQFVLYNSELRINSVDAMLYNGHVLGSINIQPVFNNYNIIARMNLTHLDMQQMFQDLFDVTAISGKSDFLIQATIPNVHSYTDLYTHLNGNIIINANHGAFQGVDFNFLAQPQLLGLHTNATVFQQLTATFNFINGISKTGAIKFVSPYVIAGGSGVIDFIHTTVNYSLTIKSGLPLNQQKLNAVIIPVTVTGNLFHPSISIQNMVLSNVFPQVVKVKQIKSKIDVRHTPHGSHRKSKEYHDIKHLNGQHTQ